jgi:hypothetical protein
MNWLSPVYRVLRSYAHWHEKKELGITAFELIVASIGVLMFLNESLEFVEWMLDRLGLNSVGTMRTIQSVQGIGETLCFFVLFFSILARMAVILRSRNLGPNFHNLLNRPRREGSFSSDEALFGELAGLGPSQDFLGAPLSAEVNTRRAALDRLARMGATQFSMRTYGEADALWKTWEERYLNEWLTRFPGTVWRIAPDNPAAGESSGYFSVIVPVTEDAWHKVRFGHLSTALAAIDEPAATYCSAPQSEPYERPLFLLAYVVIYAPTRLKGDTENSLKLLYSGVEHLAYLLSRFYPPECNPENMTLSLITESPNKSLDAVLHTLGFAPVHSDRQLDLEHTHIRKSVAGFELFEIGYDRGRPTVGDRHKAGLFLNLLCEIGRRKKQVMLPPEVEPDSEMTMVPKRRPAM